MKLYEETQPELVTLSPPCTEFSRLQALNRHLHGDAYRRLHDELKQRAIKHLEFCFWFARVQIRKGRYLIFEHFQKELAAGVSRAYNVYFGSRAWRSRSRTNASSAWSRRV